MKFRAAAYGFAALAAAGVLLAPAAQASSRPVQVSGTQLQSALLPGSDFGSGFTSGSPVSSGGSLLHRPAQGRISSLSCITFEGLPGIGSYGQTAFAATYVDNSSKLSGSPSAFGYFIQSVDQFASAQAAASYFGQAYARYATCTEFTFRDPEAGAGTLKITLRSLAKTRIGTYQAFRATESGALAGTSGFTLPFQTLAVVAGADVCYIEAVGGANAPVPASLIRDLIRRVQELR